MLLVVFFGIWSIYQKELIKCMEKNDVDLCRDGLNLDIQVLLLKCPLQL